ncbi:MAG: alpha/beta fold hydrolase [Dehalococcoidia bacterium]
MPYVPTRDIITYYEESGSGEPLVLIRGLGSDLQAWAPQVPALAKHFRVITYDNRGAGRTSAPDKPYSIAAMADDLATLLDELKIEKANVLGYSMGGMIAQEFALKHPNKLEKLILLSSSAKLDGYSRVVVQNFINIRRSNMSRDQVTRATAPFVFSADLLDDQDRFERAIQATVDNPYFQQDHAYIRQAQAVLAFDASGRSNGIKASTLVVASEEDTLLPPRNAEALSKLISGSKLVTLQGGHAGVTEYPNEYNAAFLEFLGAAVPA